MSRDEGSNLARNISQAHFAIFSAKFKSHLSLSVNNRTKEKQNIYTVSHSQRNRFARWKDGGRKTGSVDKRKKKESRDGGRES